MARGRKPNFDYALVDPKIRRMYEDEGRGLGDIAQALGLHYKQTVKRRCQAMGIDIRGVSEGMFLFHARRQKRDIKKIKAKSKGKRRRPPNTQNSFSRPLSFELLRRRKRKISSPKQKKRNKGFPVI